MKFLYRCITGFILILLINSCAKTKGDFSMENDEFLISAAQLLRYHHNLNMELKVSAQQNLTALEVGRTAGMVDYTRELASISQLPEVDLTAGAKADLVSLLNSQGAVRNKLLLHLIVLADQELIGLHVKASGPSGLKDVTLRQWTAQKIPKLITQLDHSQKVWHGL